MRYLSQKGIGLLELMLTIIVITAIILSATKYYLVAKEEMKISQAQDIVNNVAQAAYKWVEGRPDFTNLSLDDLINNGLLPGKYSGNIGPWGGKITLSLDTGKNLMLQFSNLGTATTTSRCAVLYNKYKDDSQSSVWADTNCTFYFKAP